MVIGATYFYDDLTIISPDDPADNRRAARVTVFTVPSAK